MKVAVLSDTHGLLRPEVIKIIQECDAVIHAGDMDSQKIIDGMLERRKKNAPVYMVRGNNDREWAWRMFHELKFTLEGIHFYLVHNKKDVPKDLGDRQIIIYGHSHKYAEQEKDGRLWLNPGSCGKRRFNQEITMAVLHLNKGKWIVERVDIPQEFSKEKPMEIPKENLLSVIEKILFYMDKGKQVKEISKKLAVQEEFVEQICRIRVTHPGVTANGILDKIEVNCVVTVKK